MSDQSVTEGGAAVKDAAGLKSQDASLSSEDLALGTPTIKRTDARAELANKKSISPEILISRFVNSGVISREEAEKLKAKSPEEKSKALEEIQKSYDFILRNLKEGSSLGIVPHGLDMRIRHASNTVTYDLPKDGKIIRFSLEERIARAKEIEALSLAVKEGTMTADAAKALIADSVSVDARMARLDKTEEPKETKEEKKEGKKEEKKPIGNPENKAPAKEGSYIIDTQIDPLVISNSRPKEEVEAKVKVFHENITKRLIELDPLLGKELNGIPVTFMFHPDLNKLLGTDPGAHTQGSSDSVYKDGKLVKGIVYLNPAVLDDPAKALFIVHHELTHIAKQRGGIPESKLKDEQETTAHSINFLRTLSESIKDEKYYQKFLTLLTEEEHRLKNDVPKLYK